MKLALAGDAMFGRGVAEALASRQPEAFVDDEVVAAAREADHFILNLECCISARGERWPDPEKPFFFRAPPAAVDLLTHLGVDCVTLANNHALDYGRDALLDTLDHLRAAGIAVAGAGRDEAEARAPAMLDGGLAVFAVSDHPRAYAAGPDTPGIAFDPLAGAPPHWLADGVRDVDAAAVLVSPHWGPNMVQAPLPRIRRTAAALLDAGATLVAGHSAHVFQAIEGRVLYDLGDFLDDYRVDGVMRNDLGILALVDLEPLHVETLPLKLDYCRTGVATGADAAWIARQLRISP